MATVCAARGNNLLKVYRYVLQTTRACPEKARRAAALVEARAAFEKLVREQDAGKVTLGLRDVWASLTMTRMSIPMSCRPPVPADVDAWLREIGVTGPASQVTGTFVVGKSGTLEAGQAAVGDKAKRYNMALDDADVRRHHALNERFHFGGRR